MIKLCRIPCIFTVALGTVNLSELVQMGILMALVAISVCPFIYILCLVTVITGYIIMNTL